MNIPGLCDRTAPARIVAAILVLFAWSVPAAAQSVLSVGPRGLQTLIVEQLFGRSGRWYLTDDGGCYAYLAFPQTDLVRGRLVLRARLTARLGQRIGTDCEGADFSSSVALSGKLHGSGHLLTLDDIRIDRVDDESTRNALDLALQIDPQIIPRGANLDVSEFVRHEIVAAGGARTRLDGFRILRIATRADAVVVQFDVRLSVP